MPSDRCCVNHPWFHEAPDHRLLYFETAPQSLPQFRLAAEVALEILEGPWFLGSFLMFGLGLGLMAFFGWRTATGPRWLNGLGIAGGLAGLVWLVPFLPPFLGLATVILILVNILALSAWSIGLSLWLVRS